MKAICVFLALSLTACNERTRSEKSAPITPPTESTPPEAGTPMQDTDTEPEAADSPGKASPPAKTYANARFRKVRVTPSGDHRYTVSGQGQIFEASFSWVVEDGHEELQQGHQMTSAGAPEWGDFRFTVEVQKRRPNSTLTLILFESSAKDGSRQHQLPVVLDQAYHLMSR